MDGKVLIGDNSLMGVHDKIYKTNDQQKKTTCGCKTFISAMLLQSDLNKWRLSQLVKLDKVYINYASTRPLQISKIDLIE